MGGFMPSRGPWVGVVRGGEGQHYRVPGEVDQALLQADVAVLAVVAEGLEDVHLRLHEGRHQHLVLGVDVLPRAGAAEGCTR